MAVTPEEELMLLLECAEDTFPLGRAEDAKWHMEPPGKSPTIDAMCQFERNGWITFDEVVDKTDGRLLMRDRLTAAGNARIGELNRDGVQPARAVDADDLPG